MRVAFVTYSNLPNLSEDDRLAVEELRRRGAGVEPVVWDDPQARWERYDRVVIRSCWDYHKRLGEFLGWLDRMEREAVPLWNPARVVRGNVDKSYLVDLAAAGLPVVPTVHLERGAAADLPRLLDERGWSEVVVKPSVSASAFRTRKIGRGEASGAQAELDELLASSGDFRVQEELGGSADSTLPAASLIEQARAILGQTRGPWLYARVDGVEAGGTFTLMELELTEPSLFLGSDLRAPARFAAAILKAS